MLHVKIGASSLISNHTELYSKNLTLFYFQKHMDKFLHILDLGGVSSEAIISLQYFKFLTNIS